MSGNTHIPENDYYDANLMTSNIFRSEERHSSHFAEIYSAYVRRGRQEVDEQRHEPLVAVGVRRHLRRRGRTT